MKTVCNVKNIIMPERKFFKIESCGQADSLQNANHCRPTVFVYMKVAFKCRADIIRPHGEPPYTIREDSL